MALRYGLAVALAAFVAGGCRLSSQKPVDSMEILRLNQEAMFAPSAYRADCYTEFTYDGANVPKRFEAATLTAEKPNLMRYDSWPVDALPSSASGLVSPRNATCITFACDGKAECAQFGSNWRKEVRTRPEEMDTILEPWVGFYAKSNSILGRIESRRSEGQKVEVSYGGIEPVDGVPCDRILTHDTATFAGRVQDHRSIYYIGKSDHLVRREIEHVLFDGKDGYVRDATLRHIKLDPKIDKGVFAYTVPAGVSLESARKMSAPLPRGTSAPDFTALDADKKAVKLSTLHGRLVVIDFWASWCMPCVESMPHTEEVAKKFADSGRKVVFLAVDDGEPRSDFEGWVAENRAKYPHLQFAHIDPSMQISTKLYKVSGIPTQFVLDEHGIVRASFQGYGGPTLDLENAIQAILTRK